MQIRIFAKNHAVRSLYLAAAGLVAAAWGLLIAWQNSPYAERMGHEMLGGHHAVPFASLLGGFLLSWLLMTTAMMLPASLPLLIEPPAGGRRAALRGIGYLLPWLAFGGLAFVGDSRLHELAEHGGPLAGAAGFIAPAVILAAGVYQLTTLKGRFTRRCSPGMDEQGSHEGSAVLQGLRLGLDCIGSCWALMLLMFAFGHHRLDWMAVLSGIVAAERLTPWGPVLAKAVGAGLLVWGALALIALV